MTGQVDQPATMDGMSMSERVAAAARRRYAGDSLTDTALPDFAEDGEFRPQALFEPFTLGPLRLDNRIVMAPMTRCMSPGGVPGADVAAYYRRRAEGGVGLIITEGTFVPHETAGFSSTVPVFHGEAALAGWKRVVDEVHAANGKIMPQLWHTGLMPLPTDDIGGIDAASPSGYYKRDDLLGKPASERLIAEIITAFGEAAASALRLGFDGLQIHGAHGYLIDQFFWDATNRREDSFGGDMAMRNRFARDIVEECRRRTAPDFPISFRFSQWKQQDFSGRLAQTPDDLERFLAPLIDAGVDLFDCSTRRFWEPEFAGSDMNLAGWTRKLSGKPTATVGSVSLGQDFFVSTQAEVGIVNNMSKLIRMLERGDFDLVGIGRALIMDPEWARKIRTGDLDSLLAYNPQVLDTLV